jgi:hypothetical protein
VGHLGYFHSLANVNNGAVNMGALVKEICISRDGEHFFMCILAILTSSFEKVLFSSVAHFYIGSLIWGQFSFLSSLYILVISPLSDV